MFIPTEMRKVKIKWTATTRHMATVEIETPIDFTEEETIAGLKDDGLWYALVQKMYFPEDIHNMTFIRDVEQEATSFVVLKGKDEDEG